jgi:hypothetical protein
MRSNPEHVFCLSLIDSGRASLPCVTYARLLGHAAIRNRCKGRGTHGRNGWRLGAVERVQSGGAEVAGFEIDEIGHIARRKAQGERRALDRGPVDELVVSPHRGDGGELVDCDVGRRLAADHRHQRDSRVVKARLVSGGRAALWGIQDQCKISISSVQHFEPNSAFKVLAR